MPPLRISVRPEPETEPFQFVLEGDRRRPGPKDETTWEELFTVLPDIPPGALAMLSASATVDPETGTVEWNKLAVLRFLRQTLIPEDEERWDTLMSDKDRLVDLTKVGALMFTITGEKTKRPTGPQSTSPDGLRNEPTGSEVDSSSQDTPPTS